MKSNVVGMEGFIRWVTCFFASSWRRGICSVSVGECWKPRRMEHSLRCGSWESGRRTSSAISISATSHVNESLS